LHALAALLDIELNVLPFCQITAAIASDGGIVEGAIARAAVYL
jgi:hypothetical protein